MIVKLIIFQHLYYVISIEAEGILIGDAFGFFLVSIRIRGPPLINF